MNDLPTIWVGPIHRFGHRLRYDNEARYMGLQEQQLARAFALGGPVEEPDRAG